MSDVFSPAKRSEVMSLVRSFGNKATELKLRGLMRVAGITGWRRHWQISVRAAGLKVRPDFVFRKERVAVFVDGCFWHGCPRHGRMPKQNAAFWEEKITRNQARDRRVNRELRKAGWAVVRIWECGLTVKRAPLTVARLQKILGR